MYQGSKFDKLDIIHQEFWIINIPLGTKEKYILSQIQILNKDGCEREDLEAKHVWIITTSNQEEKKGANPENFVQGYEFCQYSI